jgi:hypothetical protein
MPKEVMRSGAPPTTTAAPDAAPKPVTTPVPEPSWRAAMRADLDKMKLDPKLIEAALTAEDNRRAKLQPGAATVAKSQAAAAPAAAKPVTPAAQPAAKTAAAPAAPTQAEIDAKEFAEFQAAKALKAKKAAEKAAKEAADKAAADAAALAAATPEPAPADVPDEEASTEVPAGADTSFLPPEEDAPAAAPEPAPARQLPATQHEGSDEDAGPGAMVVRNHWTDMSEGAITGPIDRSDFKTPQIKIVQGSGPLSEKFNQGTLILQDIAIFGPPDPDKPGPPINFVPVAVQKYFREDLKRDPVTNQPPKDAAGNPMQPRNANTPEEVMQLGGNLEWSVDAGGNRLKPSWSPAARCLLVVEMPEKFENADLFPMLMELEGKERRFAPAVMYVNGGQYRAFVKPIMDATSFILCEGSGPDRRILLHKRLWKLQVVKEKSGDNMVFNPKITMLPELTAPDLREYAKSLRGA